jgi:DoxX-like family
MPSHKLDSGDEIIPKAAASRKMHVYRESAKLKVAGAVRLLVGIGVPPIGVAAAIGLILFFIAAITTHLRARDYSFGLAGVFRLLAGAALVLRLATA